MNENAGDAAEPVVVIGWGRGAAGERPMVIAVLMTTLSPLQPTILLRLFPSRLRFNHESRGRRGLAMGRLVTPTPVFHPELTEL